eukprot:CAMPEP_0117681690 /NCGR_PEP_ID=MMETSP0804-20121206/19141_1 /TAXON_ID=1074897 /ORGANISM="Tetraselmis astigmatica, Strain CCMP880" /LENGTH=154 /DNA_ID=CAMNT_0005491513 /DNA_START=339 /DNA_END=799 /DNA_ORIENTATION=+
MKCGTSTLNNHLMDHLPLFQKKKEVFAFSRNVPNPGRYDPSHLNSTLDATARYLHRLVAPLHMKRICRFSVPPKFVVSLCDPADRAWSHFRHNIQRKRGGRRRAAAVLKPGQLAADFKRMVVANTSRLRSCLKEGARRQVKHAYCSSSMPYELG